MKKSLNKKSLNMNVKDSLNIKNLLKRSGIKSLLRAEVKWILLFLIMIVSIPAAFTLKTSTTTYDINFFYASAGVIEMSFPAAAVSMNVSYGGGQCIIGDYWTTTYNPQIGIYYLSGIILDHIPPSVTLNYPDDNYLTSSASVNFSWTAKDDIYKSLTCNLSINRTVNISNIPALNGTAVNRTVYGINDGTYKWNVTCWDEVNNTNTSIARTFRVDTTPPIITIRSPANNSRLNTSFLSFNVSLNEIGVWCGLSVDGGHNLTMSLNSSGIGANYTNSSVGDGKYGFIVSCNDSAGNFGHSGTYHFLIDTIYPNIALVPPTPDNNTNASKTYLLVNASLSDSNNISSFIELDNSLAGWWRMDDTNSSGDVTYITDYTGRNNGIVYGKEGSTRTTAGYLGKGLEMDGEDSYISFGNASELKTANKTIGLWIKRKAYSDTFSYLFSSGTTNYYLAMRNNGSFYAAYRSSNGGDKYIVQNNLNPDEGVWAYIAVTFDVKGSNVNISVYKDGNLLKSQLDNKGYSGEYGTEFEIGRHSGTDTGYFNGTIDDVMLFNRCLLGDEITALYANHSPSYIAHNFTNLGDGSHTFKAYAQDIAGNINYTETRLFTVDTTPPLVSILYPEDASNIPSNSIDLNASAEDRAISLEYYWFINGSLNSTSINSNSTLNASDGFYNLTLFVSDGLQNGSATAYFRLNTIPPSFSNNKTNATNLTYNGTTVQLNITIADNTLLSSYRLSHNDTAERRWSNESIILAGGKTINAVFNYSIKNFSLDGGRFGWRVWANDSAGNANSSLIYSFDIPDRAAPNITSTSPSGTINIYRINISVTTNENAECRFISSSEGNYTTEYSNMSHNFTSLNNTLSHYSNLTLANGDYLYYARCIDNSGNVMNSSSNISFTIYTETTETVVSPPGGGGGGGGAGGGGGGATFIETRLISLDLINPGPISVLTGEEVDMPIYLENEGELPLKGILLSVASEVSDAVLTLSEDYIESLPVGGRAMVILNVKSTSIETFGKYPIVITAKVDEPHLETRTKTYLDIIDRYTKNKTQVVKELSFAKDLFRENPECLEFGEFLKQAEEALDSYEFGRSLSIMRGAIQACRDAISPTTEERELPAPPKEKAGNLLIFIIEMLMLALLCSLIVFYRRRKFRGIGRERNIEKRFEALLGSLRKEIGGELSEAKSRYQALLKMYLKIRKSNASDAVKEEYYKKIKAVHEELIRLMGKK